MPLLVRVIVRQPQGVALKTLAEMAPGTLQWRAASPREWNAELEGERIAALRILPPVLAPRADGELLGRSWSLAPANFMQTRLAFSYAADRDETIEYTRPLLRVGWMRGPDGKQYRFKQGVMTHDVVISDGRERELLATRHAGPELKLVSLSEVACEEPGIDSLVVLALYANLTAWSGWL